MEAKHCTGSQSVQDGKLLKQKVEASFHLQDIFMVAMHWSRREKHLSPTGSQSVQIGKLLKQKEEAFFQLQDILMVAKHWSRRDRFPPQELNLFRRENYSLLGEKFTE